MIIFFIVAGLACVLGATAGYFFLRRWGAGPALSGVLLGFLAGGLLFPFPIHGGVMFLGGVLWDEIDQWRRAQTERHVERSNTEFRRALERRFAGDLAFVLQRRLDGQWMEAMLEDDSMAWYDSEYGLVWSDAQTVPSWKPGGDVEPGRRFCSGKWPEGYWALPTEAELFGFWEHAGFRLSPWTGQSTPSILVDERVGMEIPVWYRGSGPAVAVRCVARGPRAPKVGYLQSDIDISRWNQYQMEKTGTLRGPR